MSGSRLVGPPPPAATCETLLRLIDVPQGLDVGNSGLAIDPPGARIAFAAMSEARVWDIDSGQEVGRWFFKVGGAAGTVAKTISAYDMAISDGVYGQSGPAGVATFRVDLNPGIYRVTVTQGDAAYGRDQMNVAVVVGSGSNSAVAATSAARGGCLFISAIPELSGLRARRRSSPRR